MTATDINQALDQVVNNFTGQRIAMPNGQYEGECTAPICWYLHYLGLPIPYMANNRADGWGVSFPHEFDSYFAHEAFQQGKAYPRGTILMWDSPHIALVLSDSGGDNVVTCFEQNADPDGAPCGVHSRTLNTSHRTCNYALVPLVAAEATCLYEDTPAKVMYTSKAQTNWWDLNGKNFNDLKPAAVLGENVPFTIGGYAHHKALPQYIYAMSPEDFARAKAGDFSTNNGINILDLKDTLPEKPVIEPAPAPPVYVPPTGAIPVPTDTTPYTLLVDVPGYSNSNAAINHLDPPAITVTAGENYMVFKRRYDESGKEIAINVTKTQGVAGAWINPKDNVIPPVAPPPPPEPSGWTPPRGEDPAVPVVVAPPAPVLNTNAWKTTFKRERVEGKQNLYRFTRDIVVFDKDEKRPKKQMYADEPVDIWGWFEKDGTTYGRPYTGDNLYWYGVPHQFLIREDDFLDLWNYKEQANRKNLSLQRQLDLAIEQAKRKFPKFFDIIKLK